MSELSVIIPIYNTPPALLERCLRSVLTLEGCAYEALLIDDGSKPATGDFCKAFIKDRPAFRYLYKENGGVSTARNMGIAEASGRYLTFLDADDILIGAPLKKAVSDSSTPDMLIFDMLLTQRGSESVWHGFDLESGAVTREQFLFQLFTTASISGPCAKLYKTRLIRDNQILFNTEFISGEDWMFVCDCGLLSAQIEYRAESTYHYFREDSTGLSRTARFPDKMLHNQLARYERKKQVVSSEHWENYTPERILSLSAVELIENLFNSAADLLLTKLYTPARKEVILSAVNDAGSLLQAPMPRKAKLKLFVLTRAPLALWPLAKLRLFYLRKK